MLDKIIRLVLVVIIAVQAFVIYDYRNHRSDPDNEVSVQSPDASLLELQEQYEATKAVLALKEKVARDLDEKLKTVSEQNKAMRESLAAAYEEIEQYSDQMLVSYGTVEETGKLLAEIVNNIDENTISGDELTALFTVMQEVEYLYESPDDFAVFHASFLGELLDLNRRQINGVYRSVLDYSEQALKNGLVPSNRPEAKADSIAWDANRRLLNEQATIEVMKAFSDDELIVFERYYKQGILYPPDFGIKPINSPLILSREDVANSGGQIFLRDDSTATAPAIVPVEMPAEEN